MANFLSQAKRKYMMTHTTGVTAQTPMNQLERMYYSQYLAGTPAVTNQTPHDQLEQIWLRKYITTNGGTVLAGAFNSDLWRRAVIAAGKTPSTNQTANMMTFWLNAA